MANKARRKPIFGHGVERAARARTAAPLLFRGFVLRVPKRERCGRRASSSIVVAWIVAADSEPCTDLRQPPWPETAGTHHGSDFLFFFFFPPRSRHMATSSFPWALFGWFPVKLLMEALPLTIYRTRPAPQPKKNLVFQSTAESFTFYDVFILMHS